MISSLNVVYHIPINFVAGGEEAVAIVTPTRVPFGRIYRPIGNTNRYGDEYVSRS